MKSLNCLRSRGKTLALTNMTFNLKRIILKELAQLLETEKNFRRVFLEEFTNMLNESKYNVGDSVKHDEEELGIGKVVAVEPGTKGNILVRWKSGTRKHHRWALKPAREIEEGAGPIGKES